MDMDSYKRLQTYTRCISKRYEKELHEYFERIKKMLQKSTSDSKVFGKLLNVTLTLFCQQLIKTNRKLVKILRFLHSKPSGMYSTVDFRYTVY